MAKKRTPKQRNQDNIAKNTGRNSSKGKKQNLATDNNEKVESDVININRDVPQDVDPLTAPPKGLGNLGNTCFFNSVMQNLCRTSGLLHVLTKSSKMTSITFQDENIEPVTFQLPSLPKLSTSLMNFLITMAARTSAGSNRSRTRVESPKLLFNQICSVAPRFRTYQQQDSQELFQCLLDGMKSEEIRRRKQAILSKFGLLGKKADAVDEDLKEKVKTYGRIACKTPTVVDILFRGVTVSSVLCDECGRITQVHEDFLDIPLPIAETHSLHHAQSSKKSSKNKSNKKGNTSIKEEDTGSDAASTDSEIQVTSFKATSASKHAKKKLRNLERKSKNKRKTPRISETAANDNLQNPSDQPQVQNCGGGGDMASSELKDSVITVNQDTCFKNGDVNVVQIATHATNSHATDLCRGMENLSIASNDTTVEVQQEREIQIETAVREVVSDILRSLESDEGTEVSHDKELTGEHDRIETEHLLGGKPIQSDVISPDCFGNDAENMVKTGHNSSPSSGNDEKSDSETNSPAKPTLFETPIKRPEVKFTGFCKKLPGSLSGRYEPDKNECSILTCLHKFTMAEMLTGSNKFGCEECTRRQGGSKPKTVYCNASKQMLVETPPLIMTLQLKRFQQTGSNLRKLSKRVVIPENLDLSPFCSNEARGFADDGGEIWYRLYGIVEHYGSMSRGHYTAYVCVRPENRYFRPQSGDSQSEKCDEEQSCGQWYHISDTSVAKSTLQKALNCNAYLIFYERVQQ